ncbi:MAG: alanine racemase [Desulfobacteraceae bacterium]|nr:alanine racemase [Desulfobacteraceae bacterium]
MNKNDIIAEVNLDKIGQNVKNLKILAGKNTSLMAVVKADGYGHGSVEVGKKALENGASLLGVARAEEALKLRAEKINCPILTLGYPCEGMINEICENNIEVSVYDYETARLVSSKAKEINKKIRVHIKIDTGMGRVGISGDEDQIAAEVKKITALENIEPVGIFTHFATADEKDLEYAFFQMNKFSSVIKKLKQKKISFNFYHCANSAGLMNIKESRNSLVRPGIAIYGLYPSPEVDRAIVDLVPAMTLKARIVQVKKVKKGFNVSYGKTWKSEKDSKLATITLGYADGFSRLLSSNTHFLINGKKAPVRGRICMDLCVADVTDIENVHPGDYAVIFTDKIITADYHAQKIGTINYEIVSSLTSRVKRVYV